MNIQVSYERPHTQWSVFNVFHLYYQHIVETNKDINFNYVNSSKLFNGNPSSYYSPHLMTIKNLDNNKYIIISYWDKAEELKGKGHGWDDEHRVQLVTSSGVHSDLIYTPFTYLCYSTQYDELSKNAKSNSEKEDKSLSFRGFLYGDRLRLSKLNKIKVIDQKIFPEENYFKELTNTKVCLSLNGVAEICNRDMEILSAKSVLLRPKLTQKFHNELIDGYHYIGFDYDSDPNRQSEIILDKFNEIINNDEFLNFISKNGYEWFLNNGTINSNVKILTEIINLEILK
jgi:hypothetical protein